MSVEPGASAPAASPAPASTVIQTAPTSSSAGESGYYGGSSRRFYYSKTGWPQW